MALARFEPRQCGETQPVAEPVEERSDAARLVAGGVAGEADLLGRQGLDRKGGEDHVFDAEAGIDCVEPLLEERREMARIAARAGGAEADPLDPAVDAVESEIEPPRSRPFPRQAGTRSVVSRSVASIRSAGSAIGSAKLNRTRRLGASPSGDNGSGR